MLRRILIGLVGATLFLITGVGVASRQRKGRSQKPLKTLSTLMTPLGRLFASTRPSTLSETFLLRPM
jgi:hypothetical protein